MEHTPVMMRRSPTEAKATWAGGMQLVSSARFRSWMATSNADGISLCSFCSGGVGAIVETRGSCKETAPGTGCAGKPSRGPDQSTFDQCQRFAPSASSRRYVTLSTNNCSRLPQPCFALGLRSSVVPLSSTDHQNTSRQPLTRF